MASQAQINIYNLALLGLGVQQQVSSPNEDSPQANACNTLFSFVFEQLARTAKWGCLNKQATLTLIQAAQGTPENPNGTTLPIPQQPWLYGYQYPSDCLFVRQILCPILPYNGGVTPQTTLNNATTPWIAQGYAIPYAPGYTTDALGNPLEVILTNQESAIANYTVNQQSPTSWDSLFTAAFVASLAAYLVPALSLDKQLQTLQISLAEKLILQARAMDANETPQSQDHVPDFIRARQGSSWRGQRGYNAYGNIGYPSMVWS